MLLALIVLLAPPHAEVDDVRLEDPLQAVVAARLARRRAEQRVEERRVASREEHARPLAGRRRALLALLAARGALG